MSELLGFVAVALVVIVTPGQDTALTIRNTVVGGRRAGVRTAFGVVCGQAVWAVCAAAGLAALLVASEPAFMAVKIAGTAYLVVLGVQALRSAVRREPAPSTPDQTSPEHELRQGLISNLGNPKMAAFFSSLLPQFAATFTGLLAYGLLFCLLTLVWLSAYAAVVARAGDLLRRARVRRAIEAVTGTVLLGLAARLATTER